MLIMPAVDIKDGKCVRLVKGDFDKKSIYNESPLEQAKEWADKGAHVIHLVDLDGALEGKPVNLQLIKSISETVKKPVQIGGGIRDINIISEYVQAGIDRIIVGTQAYKNPEFIKEAGKKFPGKIIVGIDMFEGKVAISGWKEVTETDGIEFAHRLEDYGVAEFIITDISRDGMLTGVNLKFYENILEKINLPVIASGGVSELNDIKNLSTLTEIGLVGVIIGKALYEKRFTLEEAIKVAKDAGKKNHTLS